MRAQRIANGGPERLLKEANKVIGVLGGKPIGKGCAKGAGKGGKRFRAKADWKAFNPDPNLIRPSQWGHWHPANQQQQLRSFTEDGGWMATLGAMLSGAFRTRTETRRQVLPNNTSATEKIKVQNKFEALQELEELHEKDAAADEQFKQVSSKNPGIESLKILEILRQGLLSSKHPDDDYGEATNSRKRR